MSYLLNNNYIYVTAFNVQTCVKALKQVVQQEEKVTQKMSLERHDA